MENEEEEAKSGGVAAVAIEFGNRERLSECLDARRVFEFAFFFSFFFFFFCFLRQIIQFKILFMHCSRDPQPLYSLKKY